MSITINPLNSYDVAPYTISISNNMPPSQNPINESYFSYVPGQNSYLYNYNKDGVYIGQTTQPECEKQCLTDTTCNGYSLFYPNNPTVNDINKYRCYLTKNTLTLSGDGQGRGVFTKKSDWYDKLTNDIQNSIIVEKGYNLLPIISDNKYSANTMCRGNGWNDNGGPVYAGKIKPSICSNLCLSDETCKSFDIANNDGNGNYDCWLFKHTDSNNVQGVLGNLSNSGCYKKIYNSTDLTTQRNSIKNIYTSNNNIDGNDYEILSNTVNNSMNLQTMCRKSPPGTSISGLANSRGYKTPQQCAQDCKSNVNCTGFDIARPDNNGKYDCYNFTIDKNSLYGENAQKSAFGCFRKNYTSPSQRLYTYNNWLVYQGFSGNMNSNWISGYYLYSNDINTAAQVSNTVGDSGYNKGNLVSIIIDIGSYNFTTIDIYIKMNMIIQSGQTISGLSPLYLYNNGLSNNIDNSTLNGNGGLFNNFPLVFVGTHNIWTSPTAVFSLDNLPPSDIGIGYVSCNAFTNSVLQAPSGPIDSNINPLFKVKSKYTMNNNIQYSIYKTLPDGNRIFKLSINSNNIKNKNRYIVLSHSRMLQSSLVDIVFK